MSLFKDWCVGKVARTNVCASPTGLEVKVVWAGICHDVHIQLKIVQGTLVMTSTLPKRTLGSVTYWLAVALYQ
jgi:hypothetical protein